MKLSQSKLAGLHEFSLDLADACKKLILELWATRSFGETLKEDKTPVSEVDLRAEALARDMIAEKYPTHGIMGEEYDAVNPESDYQWTLDPIDGTQNLINLIPTFGTLIGLRFKGIAVLGVIDHPVLNCRTSGGRGLGVFQNECRLTMTDLNGDTLLPNDVIGTNSPVVFGDTSSDRELFSKVISFNPNSRIYYDCYAQTLAVQGSLAVVVEPNLKIWDITPIEALIYEAGGKCLRFNERGSGSSIKMNAVFGKPRAVDLICKHLGI